jgi:Flp pilus assembly protein protease CpaA
LQPGRKRSRKNKRRFAVAWRRWLIAAVVVLILFLAAAVAADWLTTEQVKSLTAVILSPLIGLAGTAAGFYFGQKQ